ncbi:hypothetical protein XNC1_3321 [Xenorhabdus nematophila ATCC 19061]|uniref:Uncharacterized protein n=1 Tax=Xenorhabdus nematophila (strain ATCC 19061 / DSM 3370 / CCUG 14189 / LMG 1036 / NCIMB 9965 / AN6) TaxID=406817 RepID=D3VLP7_XENNA|nr:hypothetical protein XNC1_3321 [Xenorhabdus nematophila ATCC 19061]CEK24190.1 hypothetical protein XNC2_3196 [Xenorhabdus nematophila AN6/1]
MVGCVVMDNIAMDNIAMDNIVMVNVVVNNAACFYFQQDIDLNLVMRHQK